MFSLGSSLATSSELSQRRKLSIFRSERVIKTPNCSLCSVSASLTLTWQSPGRQHWDFHNQGWPRRRQTQQKSPTLKLKITEGPHLDYDPATQPTAASGHNRCARSSAATRLAAGRTTPTARIPRSSQRVEDS